jgi:hypothetical protein
MFVSQQFTFGNGAIGLTALNIANAKIRAWILAGSCIGDHV